MFPWDFNNHLDKLHRKCEVCEQYLNDNKQLQDRMEIVHHTTPQPQVEAEPQVTMDPEILDTSHQDCQVKCKYCNRDFSNVAECNMYINRRHKKVACPKCEKHFVKQADCDRSNHFRDVHKFTYSLKECSVFKYNKLELHEQMRLHHQPDFVFRCNKCIKVFMTRPQLHQHHKVEHSRVKLTDIKGKEYPCLRCPRKFLSENMFVAHSREHEENIHGCNECLWHFNTMAGLIKHCREGCHHCSPAMGDISRHHPHCCRRHHGASFSSSSPFSAIL